MSDKRLSHSQARYEAISQHLVNDLLIQFLQLSFPVKTWSTRASDVRIVSRLITFGLPALEFYKAAPHPNVDMREQFADLFTVLQVSSSKCPPVPYYD